MGLNDSYSTICSKIILMDPLPSVTRIYSLILQEETCELHVSSSFNVKVFALLVIVKSNGDSSNTNTHSMGQSHPKCDHCGR